MNLVDKTALCVMFCCVILDRYMDDDKTSEVVCVTESFCRLEGHTSQVSRLYWSPHEEGLLASASFDWTVQVT